MNLNKMKDAGKEIEAELIKIRVDVGADLAEYSVVPKGIKIISEKDFVKLARAHRGKPIIINDDKFSLAYIRDHSYDGIVYNHNQPSDRCFMQGNKVHFYWCSTLGYMRKSGREVRYCFVDLIKNVQKIDFKKAKDIETRLPLCKHCITILSKTALSKVEMYQIYSKKNRIAEYGDAKEFMDCVIAHYNGDISAKQKTRNFLKKTIETK